MSSWHIRLLTILACALTHDLVLAAAQDTRASDTANRQPLRAESMDRSAILSALHAGKAVDFSRRAGSQLGPLQLVKPEGEKKVNVPPPAFVGPRQVTAAIAVQRGALTSVQVNVDFAGQNIVGDAANEPSLAIDPTDPSKMAIGWRQFDTVTSDFREAGFGYSTDGGQSWEFGGVLENGVFRSDPVLDADADGNFYYSSLYHPTPNIFGVSVFKSMDGGKTWPAETFAHGGDKQWMVIDRTSGFGGGHIYQYWSISYSCCGEVNFTRSVDGGASFEPPLNMPFPYMQWGTMTVTPDGVLHAVGSSPNPGLGHIVSRSANAQLAGVTPTFTPGMGVDLGGSTAFGGVNPGGLLGQVWNASDHSSGPTDGYLYVLGTVWDFATGVNVSFVRSVDGGHTWSAPVRVNDDPIGTGWHWFGALSVAPNGRIDATWYDTRNDPVDANDPEYSEVFYSYSLDAGRTWSPNVPVSPPFPHYVGYPQQNKLGDYTHMRSDLGGVNLAYAATFNNEQDVYFLRIPFDCDNNSVEDPIDIAGGAPDCNNNVILDICEPDTDCNENRVRDICDIGSDNSKDCNGNLTPDECEPQDDCNKNGEPDICDLAGGKSPDCNANGQPDECDISLTSSLDFNEDGIPDECAGACCFCDGCLTLTEADCSVRLGQFHPHGTVCEFTECPPLPGNDNCADAVDAGSDFEFLTDFSNRCATLERIDYVNCDAGFQPVGADIWYAYRPPCSGRLEANLCFAETDFDSLMAVYEAGPDCDCALATGTPHGCGDDTCGIGGGPSYVNTTAELGTCYLVRVTGWAGSEGNGVLNLNLIVSDVPGDCDLSGFADWGDLTQIIDCLDGPATEQGQCCECADMQNDGTVKLDDFAVWQNHFGNSL